MSDLSPLSGEERKSNFGAARSVDGLIADIGRGGPVGRIPLGSYLIGSETVPCLRITPMSGCSA